MDHIDEVILLKKVKMEQLKKPLRNILDRILIPSIKKAIQEDDMDIKRWRIRRAFWETALFVEQHMPSLQSSVDRFALIKDAISYIENINGGGLICEFGVYKGESINYIAGLLPENVIVYGFDSFEGLPTNWGDNYPKGQFNLNKLPKVSRNVRLIEGWFDETLCPFLKEHPGNTAFLHIDGDLYLSAKTIFEEFESRIQPGTVIVFDEYFNYPGWQEGEHKAFMEFIEKTNFTFEYIGYCRYGFQVAVKIGERNNNAIDLD